MKSVFKNECNHYREMAFDVRGAILAGQNNREGSSHQHRPIQPDQVSLLSKGRHEEQVFIPIDGACPQYLNKTAPQQHILRWD
jgi:hypothetical protein